MRLLTRLTALLACFPVAGALDAPSGIVSYAGDGTAILHWDRPAGLISGFNVWRVDGGQTNRVNARPVVQQSFAAVSLSNDVPHTFRISAVSSDGTEGAWSESVAVVPRPFASPDAFLDYVQRAAFGFFWYEANPSNGLVRDRSTSTSPSSIAAVGFGLTSIAVAIDRGWISRARGRARVLATLRTFLDAPQNDQPSGTTGYRGWYYHFLDMQTAERVWKCELSSIDTGLLMAGVLDAREYFDRDDAQERQIREAASFLFHRMDWRWMMNGAPSLTMGWHPEKGFIRARWIGYNEAMILYVLGIGAEQDPVPASSWNEWTRGYKWVELYGHSFVPFAPLFGHQYSHCWIDFRNIADNYMRGRGITYFENSRRATLAQRSYCIENPGGFKGYGPDLWGLTACDGPGGQGFFRYVARGAPPPENDDGTIAPTASGGSIVFTPAESIAALRHMYDAYRDQIWTGYGFRDAFNLTANWWDPDVLGIDQGPIVIMIENHRTGKVWQRFMRIQEVRRGLERIGFQRN